MGRPIKEGITKDKRKNFLCDGYDHYLDCGDGFINDIFVTLNVCSLY